MAIPSAFGAVFGKIVMVALSNASAHCLFPDQFLWFSFVKNYN
jgi:hypothetical protein